MRNVKHEETNFDAGCHDYSSFKHWSSYVHLISRKTLENIFLEKTLSWVFR